MHGLETPARFRCGVRVRFPIAHMPQVHQLRLRHHRRRCATRTTERVHRPPPLPSQGDGLGLVVHSPAGKGKWRGGIRVGRLREVNRHGGHGQLRAVCNVTE